MDQRKGGGGMVKILSAATWLEQVFLKKIGKMSFDHLEWKSENFLAVQNFPKKGFHRKVFDHLTRNSKLFKKFPLPFSPPPSLHNLSVSFICT